MIIYVLSDSIGETGTVMIRSVVTQFEPANLEIKRFPFITNDKTIEYTLDQMVKEKDEHKLIVFTLVNHKLCEYTELKAKQIGIPYIDLLTSHINTVKNILGTEPCLKPGMSRMIDLSYTKRVSAIEFATKYDDGKDTRGIIEADIVLIGISRTSKTPLCMYMAYQSIKAANVPLVMDVEPPPEIFELPKFKVIGLTIRPDVLQTIRVNRLRDMGMSSDANYATTERILKEIDYADNIMKRIGCPVIDVSNKAIEETTGKIMQILQKSNSLKQNQQK